MGSGELGAPSGDLGQWVVGSGEERFSFFVVSNRSWGLSRKWGVGSGEWGVGSGEWRKLKQQHFVFRFFRKRSKILVNWYH